jgi:LysR family transcriptional regulator for bpeEF and oprC
VRAVLTSDDREALLAMALAGGGLIQAGMVGPAQIATGRLKRLLSEWTFLGAPTLYVLYRKTPRVAPKIAAFLEFIAETFAAFDPEELTLLHEKGFTGLTLSSRSRSRQ